MRLKELKPDNSLNQNNITLAELLKKTRRKYLYEKIKYFNDDIVNTFSGNKELLHYGCYADKTDELNIAFNY